MIRSIATRADVTNASCVALRSQLAHAERFARTLDLLLARTSDEDQAFVWLAGRGDEVRAFVGDVSRSWMIGERTEDEACAAIESYLDALHQDMHPWFGEWYAPSCCGPYAHETTMTRKKKTSGTRPVVSAIRAAR